MRNLFAPFTDSGFSACRGGGLSACALCVCVVLAGCGSGTYETRLAQTSAYFAYEHKLGENLSRSWKNSGVDIRVPKQFQEIPAPRVEEETDEEEGNGQPMDEEGNSPPPPPPDDPRQPDFIDGKLPGLLGAWKAEVPVDGHEVPLPAYLYVLGNYSLWLEGGQGEEALKFHETATNRIANALGVPSPAPEQWENQRLPRGEGFVSRKAYTSANLEPRPEIHGAEYDASIYLTQAGDIQAVVLFLIPHEVDPRENLGERIALCLETLEISDQKPASGGESEGRRGDIF